VKQEIYRVAERQAGKLDQSLQAVVFFKSIDKPFAMSVGAPGQVACDTDVQDAVAPIGHEINPAARHFSD
jgi:hypothetical protein